MDPAKKLRKEMDELKAKCDVDKCSLVKAFQSVDQYINIAKRLYTDELTAGRWIKK